MSDINRKIIDRWENEGGRLFWNTSAAYGNQHGEGSVSKNGASSELKNAAKKRDPPERKKVYHFASDQ